MEEQDLELEKAKDLLKNSKHILLGIICDTFARDAKISEQEFKERIGFGDSELSEQECIRLSVANLLVEKTIILCKMKNAIENNVALIQEIKRIKEKNNE